MNNLKDKLYFHGFSDIEWHITKEVYLILQKIFMKDIFEEIVKYCGKKSKKYHQFNKDIISEILSAKNQIVYIDNINIEGDGTPTLSTSVILTNYKLMYGNTFQGFCLNHISTNIKGWNCGIWMNRLSKIRINRDIKCPYHGITIWQYHDINMMRRDKEMIKKMIEDMIKEERDELFW